MVRWTPSGTEKCMRKKVEAAEPVKDKEEAHPVAVAGRPILCEVVRAFVIGDYKLALHVVSNFLWTHFIFPASKGSLLLEFRLVN